MTLLQLKQIVDKALEEQPELAEKEVCYANSIIHSFDCLRLAFGQLKLTKESSTVTCKEGKLWLP